MEHQDKHRLRANRCALLDIDPDIIKDHLIQEGVFTPKEMDTLLLSQPTPKDRMGSLLTELENRGKLAYGKFKSVLSKFPYYEHLVEKLDNTPLPVPVMEEVDGAPVEQAQAPMEQAKHLHVTITGKNHFTMIGCTDSKVNKC